MQNVANTYEFNCKMSQIHMKNIEFMENVSKYRKHFTFMLSIANTTYIYAKYRKILHIYTKFLKYNTFMHNIANTIHLCKNTTVKVTRRNFY